MNKETLEVIREAQAHFHALIADKFVGLFGKKYEKHLSNMISAAAETLEAMEKE